MTLIFGKPMRTHPAEKVVNGTSTVAKQFRPFIFLLSATSPYGIGVCTPQNEKQGITYVVYKLSWKQPLSMYALGILFWIVFCVCISVFNIALDIPFPINLVKIRSPGNTTGEGTLSQSTSRLLIATLGCCRLLEFTGLFFSAPLLAKWLNELTAIETHFNILFSHLGKRMDINITRVGNYLALFYVMGPGALWMTANSMVSLPQYQFNWNYSALGYIWFVSITFYIMVPELMEDVKMILMFETSRRIYSCMRSGIRTEVMSFGEIKEKNIIAWDGLITKLRRHVKLTGKCLRTQLILNICETVFVLSFGTYVVIRHAGGYTGGTSMGYAIIGGFYCVVMAARLFIKVGIAERIYSEERLLMKDLKDSEVRVRTNSLEALNELRNLQQSLKLVPTRIQVGSFCDLDSKLLVQVVLQTLPLLIAVAQFQGLV